MNDKHSIIPPTIAPNKLEANTFARSSDLENEVEKMMPAKKMGRVMIAPANTPLVMVDMPANMLSGSAKLTNKNYSKQL